MWNISSPHIRARPIFRGRKLRYRNTPGEGVECRLSAEVYSTEDDMDSLFGGSCEERTKCGSESEGV